MSRYDHKIETSLEGIEHLSKEKKCILFVTSVHQDKALRSGIERFQRYDFLFHFLIFLAQCQSDNFRSIGRRSFYSIEDHECYAKNIRFLEDDKELSIDKIKRSRTLRQSRR